MSFAQSYVLASKVRGKLTKDASNAQVPLRNLVLQANMLDNLMDHISNENNKRLEKLNNVKFQIPQRPNQESQYSSTSVQEYEVSSDSDEYESDSDSDYYYSSDEEVEEIEDEEPETPRFKLSTISEESEVPELTESDVSEESEDEIEDNYTPSLIHTSLFGKHQRNDAIYLINEVY